MIYSLIHLVAVILIVGAVLWGIDRIGVISAEFKNLARIILIVALVIYAVLTLLGLVGVSLRW